MPAEPTHFFSRPIIVFCLATLCTLLWGSAYPAIKTGYVLLNIEAHDVASQMVFAGQRFLLAGLFLIILCVLFRKRFRSLTRQKMRQILVLGLTQTSLQYIFFYIGVAFATGVKASIMNSTGTFFSVLLAHFIYQNDRLTHRRTIGVIIGFLGVFIVNFNKSLLNFDFSLLGEGSVVFAAFILAAASIYGKKISQGIDAMVMTAWQLAIGGLALLLIGLILGGHSGEFDLASTVLLIYLAGLSSAAFALWSVLLKYNSVSKVTIFNFLVPVFGSSLSSLFLGEAILEAKNIIALILVCSGIYLVTLNKPVVSFKQ
ncbi:DMT family transporter [Vibrio tritonius]|uniref:DMT family transporter n=1 Tax=Vibrio tritonius TaxID=1435069 RepID=UPI000837F3C1|nr:DMT family transporter [Vibrio tritonius]